MADMKIGNELVRKLDEASLSRVTMGHDDSGYVAISACRAKENLEDELGRDLDDKQAIAENNRRTRELAQKLKMLGYSYIPVYGGYHEEGALESSYEKSFVVYPFNKSRSVDFEKFFEDLIKLGKKYNQDSILRKAPGEKAKYINCHTGEVEVEFDGMSFNDISKEYFTALKKYNIGDDGSPQGFSFEGLFAPVSGSIMESHRRDACGELFFNSYKKED